jgi:hypothetical protein
MRGKMRGKMKDKKRKDEKEEERWEILYTIGPSSSFYVTQSV